MISGNPSKVRFAKKRARTHSLIKVVAVAFHCSMSRFLLEAEIDFSLTLAHSLFEVGLGPSGDTMGTMSREESGD